MLCLEFVFCVFFFFKQKTAYEMRISDWSSEVCSSDLVGEARLMLMTALTLADDLETVQGEIAAMRAELEALREQQKTAEGGADALVGLAQRLEEIGRGSCRARMCQ